MGLLWKKKAFKSKKKYLNRIWVFSAVSHPAMFYFCLNIMDTQKRSSDIFSMYILWKNLMKCLSETNIFLWIHQVFNILDP